MSADAPISPEEIVQARTAESVPTDLDAVIGKSLRDEAGVGVRERARRPKNARVVLHGPDPEECPRQRAALWRGKPPPSDKVGQRRMYDMNKHLADDLRDRVLILVGRPKVPTSR